MVSLFACIYALARDFSLPILCFQPQRCNVRSSGLGFDAIVHSHWNITMGSQTKKVSIWNGEAFVISHMRIMLNEYSP